MQRKKKRLTPEELAEFAARVRGEKEARADTYRERALALYPHICARCGREFSGKDLRDLTVHHKDNNHMNNPNDGSNWELLCVQCHDDAHQDFRHGSHYNGYSPGSDEAPPLGHNPFAGLGNLLKTDDKPEEGDK